MITSQLVALLLVSSCALLGAGGTAPLEFESLTAEGLGPSTGGSTGLRWTAAAAGGAGELDYEFRILRGSDEVVAQEGPSPVWDWDPKQAGRFRVKVTVEDGAGARVESGWSSACVVIRPVSRKALIAVLPVEDLTGSGAPVEGVDRELQSSLREEGFRLVDDESLAKFMKRYRIRHTGGLSSDVARAMKEETGAEAFLVTSLAGYQERIPPMISLISRLVSAGEHPVIQWMDGAGLSGEDSPGLLGLGRIERVDILLEKAVQRVTASLEGALPEVGKTIRVLRDQDSAECDPTTDVVAASATRRVKRKFRPQTFFRSPIIDSSRRYRVAVVPFLNLSERRHAGSIVTLQLVDELVRNEMFSVVEPGLVREELLEYRMIMQAGPSLANADILFGRSSLGADLVCSGTVFDYQDGPGTPKVDFSVTIFERTSREVVWYSRSYGDGDEGVFFFDLGRVRTAHRLASEMVGGTLEVLSR